MRGPQTLVLHCPMHRPTHPSQSDCSNCGVQKSIHVRASNVELMVRMKVYSLHPKYCQNRQAWLRCCGISLLPFIFAACLLSAAQLLWSILLRGKRATLMLVLVVHLIWTGWAWMGSLALLQVHRVGSESDRPEFTSRMCLCPGEGPWARHFLFRPHLPLHRVVGITVSTSGVVVRIKWAASLREALCTGSSSRAVSVIPSNLCSKYLSSNIGLIFEVLPFRNKRTH